MTEPTCKSCGYEKSHCACESNQAGTTRRRNTSGETVKYQNYQSYPQESDYAMTSRISRTSNDEIKIMEELNPVDGETLQNYIKRKSIAEAKLTEYSITHHLYGTKRVWSCHTTSRYCFICTMAQLIDNNTAIYKQLAQLDINPTIRVTEAPNGEQTISLEG